MATLVKLTVCTALFISLSGCASYFQHSGQNTCFKKDWLALGFKAAAHGYPLKREWSSEDSICRKYNVWSNQAEFARGYELGREVFCQPENGFEFGQRDRNYYPICGPTSQTAFDEAYRDGKRLYRRHRKTDEALELLNGTQDFIDYAYHRRKELAYELEHAELDEHTKKKYVKERYRLKKRKRSAEYDLPRYRSDVREARIRAANLEHNLYQEYYPIGLDAGTAYSIDQSLVSENTLVSEAALLIYKPERFYKAERAQLKKQIYEISDHITANHPRSMRFQVVGNTTISMLDGNGSETRLSTAETQGQAPQLLFWSPEHGLETQTLKANTPPPLSKIDRFLNRYRGEPNLAGKLISEFDTQVDRLSQQPYRNEAEKCRRANHPSGSIGAVKCIGPLLVDGL